MSRATKADKAQRVNAAFRLLQQQTEHGAQPRRQRLGNEWSGIWRA